MTKRKTPQAERTMRIRLVVRRNGLPPTQVLWTFGDGDEAGEAGISIAQFLEQVNDVVPLEADEWGLEDYSVEVRGFECLHFSKVHQVLHDDDEVCIRPLETADLRIRKISGRHQISEDGRHLIDGVAFGRPFLRKGQRPTLRIPSRKKLKLTQDDSSSLQSPLQNASPLLIEHASDDAESRKLLLLEETANDEDAVLSDRLKGLSDEAPRASEGAQHHQPSHIGDTLVVRKLRKRKPTKTATPTSTVSTNSSSTGIRDSRRSSKTVRFDHVESPSSPSGQTQAGLTGGNVTEFGGVTRGALVDDDNDDEDDSDFVDPGSSSSDESESVTSDKENASPKSVGPTEVKVSSKKKSDKVSSRETLKSNIRAESSSDSESSDSSSLSSSSRTSSDTSDAASADPSRNASSIPHVKDVEKVVTGKSVEVTAKPVEQNVGEVSQTQTSQDDGKNNVKDQAVVAPGAGMSKTKKRNERRRNARALKALVEAGKLPEGSDHAALARYRALNGENETEPSREEVSQDKSGTHSEQRDKNKDLDTTTVPRHTAQDSQEANGLSRLSQDPSSSTQEYPSSEHLAKRPRLDLASSKRMLFGSLGLRMPKNREEEAELQNKLMAIARPASSHTAAKNDGESNDTNFEDGWREKLVLHAVECCAENVEYSEPPFPFHQRWDPKQDEYRALAQRNGPTKASKKRKRKQATEQNYQDEQYHDGDHPHDEGTTEVEDEETRKSADLPELPADLSALPNLRVADCQEGVVVAFQQLELTAATRWQPMVSKHRTATITQISDDETFTLRWASRDQPVKERLYDEDTGERIYNNFDMPGYDDDEEAGHDATQVKMVFSDMINAKLVRAPSNSSVPDLTREGEAVEAADEPKSSSDPTIGTTVGPTRETKEAEPEIAIDPAVGPTRETKEAEPETALQDEKSQDAAACVPKEQETGPNVPVASQAELPPQGEQPRTKSKKSRKRNKKNATSSVSKSEMEKSLTPVDAQIVLQESAPQQSKKTDEVSMNEKSESIRDNSTVAESSPNVDNAEHASPAPSGKPRRKERRSKKDRGETEKDGGDKVDAEKVEVEVRVEKAQNAEMENVQTENSGQINELTETGKGNDPPTQTYV